MVMAFAPGAIREALETSNWIERAGRTAVLAPFTASTEEGCAEMIQLAIECFGRIDVIANTDDVPPCTRVPSPLRAETPVGRSAGLLYDACAVQMSAGGAITDTFCAKDDLCRRGDIYEAEAAMSALALSCAAKSLRANGVCIGTPQRFRNICADEHAALPMYLAEIATAHVLCATESNLNGAILLFR